MEKKYMGVYSIREYKKNDETKTKWLRVGAGFVNSDGSYNIRLNALPLMNPATGTVDLHMRYPIEKDETDETKHWDEEEPF